MCARERVAYPLLCERAFDAAEVGFDKHFDRADLLAAATFRITVGPIQELVLAMDWALSQQAVLHLVGGWTGLASEERFSECSRARLHAWSARLGAVTPCTPSRNLTVHRAILGVARL